MEDYTSLVMTAAVALLLYFATKLWSNVGR
jgi:hypothetical protein